MKNTKKTLSVLLSILMVFTLIPWALVPALAEGEPDGQSSYVFDYDDQTKTLTITGQGALPDIPMFENPSDLLAASPWLSVAADAENLVIGDGITRIGDFNFALMTELTTVTLPASLTAIGDYAFAYCTKLRNITLPAGLTQLGGGAFVANDLQSIDIPAGVQTLANNFIYQDSLTAVTLHEGLESISNCFAFAPIGSITIPSTVTSVEGCMFLDTGTLVNRSAAAVAADQFSSVSEPGMGIVLCKYYALHMQMEAAYMMSGEITPEMEDELEAQVMESFRVWLNETYGLQLETLEDTMAYAQPYMRTYQMPRSDVQIYCLSASAEHTYLDSNGYPHYLSDLDNAVCNVQPQGSAGDTITWSLDLQTGVLTFTGHGEMSSYLNNAGYKFYKNEITSVSFVQEGGPITSIGAEAFRDLPALTSLTVPEGVTRIGANSIRDSGVRTLTLPSTLGMEQSSEWLRLGSTPLQSIALAGNSPTYFTQNGALYKRNGDHVTLVKFPAAAVGQAMPANVTMIGDYAIEGLADLSEFTVPGSVYSIGNYAFCNLPALQTLSFAAGTAGYFNVSDTFMYGTGVTSLVADPADTRIASANGVLYTKDMTALVALPEHITAADLPASVEQVYNDHYIYIASPLQRLTVRNPEFRFPAEDYLLSFTNKNTVIAGYKGSTAEDYALTRNLPLELLDGVTVTGVSLDFTDAVLTIPQYESFSFSDLGVKAVVTYSDGTTSEKTGDQLLYTYVNGNGDTYHSVYMFEELGEYQFTVSYGDAMETFTATVTQSNITYEFDTSEMIDEISVFEYFNPEEMNVKLYKVNADNSREEISFWNVETQYWDETAGETGWTENTGTRRFDSPRDVRIKFSYRGASMETVLHVTENAVRFTVDTAGFVSEAERFSIYDKDTCGLRLYVTRNGQTTELTSQMNIYDNKNQSGGYSALPIDTFEVGEEPAYMTCYYSYQDPVRGYVDLNFVYPFTVNVVQGDVTDIALDISDVTDSVRPYRTYTAGDLGVKLIKTMANGETVVDSDPPVTFEIVDGNSYSYTSTLFTSDVGKVYQLTAKYIKLAETFTVTVRQTAEYTIDDSEAKTTFLQYLEPFSPAAMNLRFYRTANGETTEITDYSRISYGWSDGMPSANTLGTHTVELYYRLDDGTGEKIGAVQYEVVDSGAQLLMNDTPTTVAQFDVFTFNAAAVANDNGTQVNIVPNLYYYVNDANHNTVGWNTFPTAAAGTYTVTPYGLVNGSYLYFYDWAFEVTVTPETPTFRLDLTDLVTQVGTYQLYSADTWGVRGWRTRNGEDVEEVMVQFWYELPNGESNQNRIPTDAAGSFVIQPFVFYGTAQYDVGDPITVTVTESGFTYEITERVYPTSIPQFGSFSVRAKLTPYHNGTAEQFKWMNKYLAEDAAGEIYDNYLFTQIPGQYTITPYYDYNGNRIFDEPFTLTVEPLTMPALMPTDEQAVTTAADAPCAFTFTAPADGTYSFGAVLTEDSPANCYPVLTFYDDDMAVAFNLSSSSGTDTNFEVSRYMTAGESYSILVRDFYNVSSSFLIRVDHVHSTSFVAEVASTCKDAGTAAHYVCGICGKTFADAAGAQELTDLTLELAAHTPQAFGANDPTCAAAGNTEYWYCGVCEQYFSDAACTAVIAQADTVIAAINHRNAVHHNAKDATCAAEGNIEYWYCPDCETYFSDSACTSAITEAQTVIGINASAHDYGAWTKLNDQKHQRVCANDPNHVETADHSWNGGTVTASPTCSAKGVKTFTCTVCGATKTQELAAVGHKDDNNDGWCDYNCGTPMINGQPGQPTQPSEPSGGGDECPLCHEHHTGFFGKIVGFFHRIIYFFKNLFSR